MKIYSRGDGRFLVKYKDIKSGKWVQKAFREKSAAQQFVAKMGGYEDGERLTVNECCLQYIAAKPDMSRRRVLETSAMLKGIAASIADKFVDELKLFDLERLQRAGKEQGLSNTTINLRVGMLKAAFNWAAQHDLLLLNPWGKYRSLKNDAQSRKADLEDFKSIYQWLPEWAQWACRTCIALCLRPGKELVSLTWNNFNWRKGCVTVFMPKVREKKIVFPPKDYLLEAVEKCKSATCEFVVPSYHNKKLVYMVFGRAWRDACKRLSLKEIAPYCMRHLSASLTLEGGGSLTSVAAQLGHQQVQTTESYYLHGSEKGQQRASDALPYGDIFQNEKKE